MTGKSIWPLCALLMACATLPPEPPPPSQLVVTNQSAQTYRLFVDSDYLLEVGPARSILVRNLPNKPYTLLAQGTAGDVAADIDPGDGQQLMAFPIPGAAEVEERTASLKLDNPTRQDLEVAIGKERIGRSFARSTNLFENLPTGDQTLTFTHLTTGGVWQRQVSLPALQVAEHTVSAPEAKLRFANDSQEALVLNVLQQEIRVEPGQTVVIDELPPGLQKLHVRFLATGRSSTLEEMLAPDEEKLVSLSDASGNITITNRLSTQAEVFMDKERIALVDPGQSHTIRGLAPGRLVLSAQAAAQYFEQPFLVAPDGTQVWVLEAGNTQLLVRNRIGETVTLFVDERPVMEIQDQQAVRFPVEPGPHSVSVSCEATGHTTRRHLDVPGARLVEVTFGPLPGRLYIENKTAKTLRFFRNGKPLDMLQPGEWAEHSGLPLGSNLVEVLDEKGTTLVSRTVTVVPRSEPRVDVVVESTETELLVRNETGEAIRVGPPARADNKEIANDAEARVFLPGAKGVLKLKGVHTGNRYDRHVDGAGGQPVTIVLAPVTGGIVVENATKTSMAIHLDGDEWASIAPGETLRRDRVAPGQHRLIAKRNNVPFEEVSCRLVEESWYVWRIEEKTASLRVLNRTKEALKLLREGSPAGILQPGTEVRFDGLEPGPVMVSAWGQESGQYHHFEVRTRADKVAQWKVLPASGGVRLHGFDGQGATISINGTEVLSVPANIEEPVALPLTGGVHALRIRFDDGKDVVGIVRVTANLYSTLHVSSGSPRVTLRNETTLPLTVFLDGVKVTTVAAAGEREVVVEHAGRHTLSARHDGDRGEWLLKEVYLDRGRAFGWTITE